MTKDEALDLALYALELEDMACRYEKESTPEHIAKAITAIKQTRALDKMAENARELRLDYEPDYKVTVVDDQHPNGIPLEQWGKPAPVQEPVAWVEKNGDLVWQNYEAAIGRNLYTTPPAAQRQWVGLTDEEVERIKLDGRDLEFVSMTALHCFARDIQAKLKEKNT